MHHLFVLLIVIFVSSAAFAQKATPSPTPTPVELNLERVVGIESITFSLKTLPAAAQAFVANEDGFSIRLPEPTVAYKAAVFPKPGDMPTQGKVAWQMMESYIEIGIMPVPPGMIASWSSDRVTAELKNMAKASLEGEIAGEKISEKEIKLGSIIGLELKSRSGDVRMYSRYFLANDRAYILVGDIGSHPEAEILVKKAFDTFQFTNK